MAKAHPDPGSRIRSIHDVKPGQYMWLLPSARLFDSDKQGYLVPKKGVAAQMRSAPTGKALRGSKQRPMPQPASAKNARAARLAKRSGSPSVAPVTEKQKQGVLLLIRATQALYDSVGARG